jgi:hypothetical protein
MAVYLESPPSPCSVPLGGLTAPPGVSGDRSVAPKGVPTGSELSPMRGIGVNVGASLFNMGGLGVPEGMPVSNMGGLGCWPDPDEGVSAPPHPQHGSPLPLLNPAHLPSYRSPTSGASSGLGVPPPLVAFGGVAGAPLSVLHPPQLVYRSDPNEKGSASPCSRRGALFPSLVSWSGCSEERPGMQSSVDGYQGGRSSSSSSGSREGPWGSFFFLFLRPRLLLPIGAASSGFWQFCRQRIRLGRLLIGGHFALPHPSPCGSVCPPSHQVWRRLPPVKGPHSLLALNPWFFHCP